MSNKPEITEATEGLELFAGMWQCSACQRVCRPYLCRKDSCPLSTIWPRVMRSRGLFRFGLTPLGWSSNWAGRSFLSTKFRTRPSSTLCFDSQGNLSGCDAHRHTSGGGAWEHRPATLAADAANLGKSGLAARKSTPGEPGAYQQGGVGISTDGRHGAIFLLPRFKQTCVRLGGLPKPRSGKWTKQAPLQAQSRS